MCSCDLVHWLGRFLFGVGLASMMIATAAAQAPGQHASDTVVGRSLEAPTNIQDPARKFWLRDSWFEDGQLPVPNNYPVVSRQLAYANPEDGTEIPAILYRPDGDGKFPAVLFQHGRRGLDEPVRKLALRLAARGFIVLAPDVYTARFIDPRPIEHLAETEQDVDAAVDVLIGLGDVSTTKICTYSHTRGGYYTLKVATTFGRQHKQIACYVSSYPHWQDPNAGEPMQVYRYASEVDQLSIPTLIFMGEYEQYQRRRSIESAVLSMKRAGRDVRLITYPGVGRGFDFRPQRVRTFADDLATKDSTQRMAEFISLHLQKWQK